MERGSARYGPGPVPGGPPPVDSRPLGLDDQVSLPGLLAGHRGKAGIGEDVVEETWPA